MRVADIQRSKFEVLRARGHANILAIETSCDETGAAIVKDGRWVLSNSLFSQIALHAVYGGVVPEIASRAHVGEVNRMVRLALEQAGMSWEDVDALAVTAGPGLVGALLTGVSCAKALAYALKKPLIPVNHIEGHVSANYLTDQGLKPPFLCLVVSGGHSHLVMVRDYGVYELVGQTLDDAAGEVFDKAARVLGLPYPGGPLLDKLAETGDPMALKLPRPITEGRYDYSFSGLKTALINQVHKLRSTGKSVPEADIAASFRWAVVEALVDRATKAAEALRAPALAIAGGVAANRLLRSRMGEVAARLGIPLTLPPLDLCTDNAAMIGSAAFYRLMRGEMAGLELNAQPALRLV